MIGVVCNCGPDCWGDSVKHFSVGAWGSLARLPLFIRDGRFDLLVVGRGRRPTALVVEPRKESVTIYGTFGTSRGLSPPCSPAGADPHIRPQMRPSRS